MSRTSAFRAVISTPLNGYGILAEYATKAAGNKYIKEIVFKPAPLDDSILRVDITKYAKYKWNKRVDNELCNWVRGLLNLNATKKIEQEGEKAVICFGFDSLRNRLECGIKNYRDNLKRDW